MFSCFWLSWEVNAWNKTMQNTYHKYIPGSYGALPSKAANIRANTAASGGEQKFKGYSQDYGSLAHLAMQGAKEDSHKRRSHGSDAASYMPKLRGSGMAAPDFHDYLKAYDQKSTEDYADTGVKATREDWDQNYQSGADWDNGLSGVVPSFVRFQETPQPLG